MTEINSLIFNSLEVYDNFKWLLEQRLIEDDVYELFDRKDVNLVPLDVEGDADVDLPAVTLEVNQNGYINKDDVEIQRYTPFTAEINVYTSGSNKVRSNMELCNIIIRILQSNGQLPNYYCRGLRIEDNRPVNTFLEGAYRRVIRMSGQCDNFQKLIK